MVRDESSCSDNSEYVWDRGMGCRGSLRSSYGWPMLTLVSRIVTMQIRCNEKLPLFYFWSDRFETNRTWALILGVHLLFVSKRSDQNWRSDFFSATAHLRHDKCRNEGQLRP